MASVFADEAGQVVKMRLAANAGKMLVGLVAVFVVSGSVFTIDQTELGNVRRFGTVLYPPNEPLKPGFHFKIPFIDIVDRVPITLTTLHIPAFDVLTIDNQRVSLDINFNYTIPASHVYHLMYEVGRSGNADIESQVIPVAKDRTARIFASQNMISINTNREAIQQQVEQSVTKAVEDLFGIQAHSLQISSIKPSEAFMRSVDDATIAKNAAIAAENQKRTKQFEADQVVITSKGRADSEIEGARGDAEATRMRAEAKKTQLELEGKGEEARLEAEIKPFGSPENYIKYLEAKAKLRWNGQQPQIIAGGSAATNLIVPLPAPTINAATH